jgi:hypothetical protein
MTGWLRAPGVPWVFGLMTLSGFALVVLPRLDRHRTPSAGLESTSSDARISKNQFTAHVRRFEGVDAPSPRLLVASLRSMRRAFTSIDAVTAEIRMERTMPGGFEYDSDVDVAFARKPDQATLDVSVHSERQNPRFRLQFSSDRTILESHFHPDDPGSVHTLVPGQASRLVEIPLGFGDVFLTDMLAFGEAMAGAPPELLGYVRGSNSETLGVLELPYPKHLVAASGDVGRSESTPGVGLGASALIYFGVADGRLRAVRVFDSTDRLARTYRAFPSEEDSPVPIPSGFSVDSNVVGSRTDLWIRRFELKHRRTQ